MGRGAKSKGTLARRVFAALVAVALFSGGLAAATLTTAGAQESPDDPPECRLELDGQGLGPIYTSPCPDADGVKVEGATQWHEGRPRDLIKQYWEAPSIGWGSTISAHTTCQDGFDASGWSVGVAGQPVVFNLIDPASQKALIVEGSESASFKIISKTEYTRIARAIPTGDPLFIISAGCVKRHFHPLLGEFFQALGGGGSTWIRGNGDLDESTNTNHPPTASCAATQSGPAGRYQFVASATDTDGDALSYTWNYGDGSATETGLSRVHDYTKPGTFDATVSVSDGKDSVVAHCEAAKGGVKVDPPALGLEIVFPDKTDGRVQLDEMFTARLRVSTSDGVGDLHDIHFQGDPLRLSPTGHLEIVEGPTPSIPANFTLGPNKSSSPFEYKIHVIGPGGATLASDVAAIDAANRTVDPPEVTRNVGASPLKVTIKPSKNDFTLEADSDGRPKPEVVEVKVTVENPTDDPIENVVMGPMDLAAEDPHHTYDPFPAEMTGGNADVAMGTIPAKSKKEEVRKVRVLGDGHMKLLTLINSDAGRTSAQSKLTTGVKTLLRMKIDGQATRRITAGGPVTFFGHFENVSNDRTVAITDPMKVRRTGNIIGGGLIAELSADHFPKPLITKLAPGEIADFELPFYTERPTVADYNEGTADTTQWTRAQVDFTALGIRAAVEEDDGTWQALSTDDPCPCSYPESAVIEGGNFGVFDIEIDTTELVEGDVVDRLVHTGFGLTVGALEEAQHRASGLLQIAHDVGNFVFDEDFRDEILSREIIKGRLKESLDYLSEIAVWMPQADIDEIHAAVAEKLVDAYDGFSETVKGGIPRVQTTPTEEQLAEMALQYVHRLQGAWRRGEPNELMDAVRPIGGFVGGQASDALVGEVVFQALIHMSTLPRYAAAAKERWESARTIAQMQDKLPSLAQDVALLDAEALAKSNHPVLENAFATRRPLSNVELGGAEGGAGLARETIETGRQWSKDNPNQVIVIIPNEARSAALRDAGLAVGKIENIKPKTLASIEYKVFGGREEDLNLVVLRDIHMSTDEMNKKVDALIAAGELAEEDRAVAAQILETRQYEWKVFTDRGLKHPETGEIEPDPEGIGRLKAYDEATRIPSQFRGEDNALQVSGPLLHPRFKLEYYKDGKLLSLEELGKEKYAKAIKEADYVRPLQEHPKTRKLVPIAGDDDGIFLGFLNGLGFRGDQLIKAYASIWNVFTHPFSDSWLAHVASKVRSKLKIFSRYFTENPITKEPGKPLVMFVNGEAWAVKIDPHFSRFDPLMNHAYLKWVGAPQGVDPINPGGWVKALMRPVKTFPLPALYLRWFIPIPSAATNPDAPLVPSAKRARVLRLDESGHVESWTPTTGWRPSPDAEAEAANGTVAVAPQTTVIGSIESGATRVEITSQEDMGLTGDWFEVGDEVVFDPGGTHEETAIIDGFGSLILDRPLKFDHAAGEMVSYFPASLKGSVPGGSGGGSGGGGTGEPVAPPLPDPIVSSSPIAGTSPGPEPTASTPSAVPTCSVGSQTTVGKRKVRLSGAGWSPNTTVRLSFDARKRRDVQTDPTGAFSVWRWVPRGAKPGDHAFHCRGTDVNGLVSDAAAEINVVRSKSASTFVPAHIGAELIGVAGFLMAMWLSWRRRRLSLHS